MPGFSGSFCHVRQLSHAPLQRGQTAAGGAEQQSTVTLLDTKSKSSTLLTAAVTVSARAEGDKVSGITCGRVFGVDPSGTFFKDSDGDSDPMPTEFRVNSMKHPM